MVDNLSTLCLNIFVHVEIMY